MQLQELQLCKDTELVDIATQLVIVKIQLSQQCELIKFCGKCTSCIIKRTENDKSETSKPKIQQ